MGKERFDEILVPLYSAFSTECYEACGHTINWDEVNIAHVRRLYHKFGLDASRKLIASFYKRLTPFQKKRGYVEPRHIYHDMDGLSKAVTGDVLYELIMSQVEIAEEVHNEKFIESERMQRWYNDMTQSSTVIPYSVWIANGEKMEEGNASL